jgi:hypothetical protein
MVKIFGLVLLLIFPITVLSQDIPVNAELYLPTLNTQLNTYWPALNTRYILGGQIEQETCVSLTSKKCWSSRAELKTDREYGFGLGMITKTDKFDTFQDAKKLDKSLSSWKWEDRFDASYQLKTLVLMDKKLYDQLPKTIFGEYNRLAFTLSAYNGGMGSVLNDRRLCQGIKGCEPNAWFDQVEKQSFKQKTKLKGYGKSFFDINREYVRNIMTIRAYKYFAYLQ